MNALVFLVITTALLLPLVGPKEVELDMESLVVQPDVLDSLASRVDGKAGDKP